jgi:hypothetical protein
MMYLQPIHASEHTKPTVLSRIGNLLSKIWGWIVQHEIELLPNLIYTLVLLPYLNYQQIYDGNEYFTCVQGATTQHFAYQNLACFGHPSFVFLLPYWFLQKLLPGAISFNALTLILGNVAVVAFAYIVRALFPSETKGNRVLMVLLFALHPAILGSTLHFSLDIGVLFFFLFLLALLIAKKPILAALSGLVLVFTKEAGIVLYVITILSFLVLFIGRMQIPLRSKYRTLIRWSIVLIPIIAFIFYMRVHPTLWKGTNIHDNNLYNQFLQLNIADKRFQYILANIFVLNFLWVSSLWIALALLQSIGRYCMGLPGENSGDDVNNKLKQWIIFLAIAALFALSRSYPSNNIRYLSVAYALFLLVFFISVRSLFKATLWQTIVLVIVLALNTCSIYRTLDPLSEKLYGTFRFGERTLLSMSSIDGSCCGAGRDTLMYNLEFAPNLSRLYDATLQAIRPNRETTIVTSGAALMEYGIDRTTFERISGNLEKWRPRYTNAGNILRTKSNLPRTLYFIHLPNFDTSRELKSLLAKYAIEDELSVEHMGYVMRTTKLSLRADQEEIAQIH